MTILPFVGTPLASLVLLSPYREKKENLQACLDHQRRHFSPFVASCDGLLGNEAKVVEHYKNRCRKPRHEMISGRSCSETTNFIMKLFVKLTSTGCLEFDQLNLQQYFYREYDNSIVVFQSSMRIKDGNVRIFGWANSSFRCSQFLTRMTMSIVFDADSAIGKPVFWKEIAIVN